MLPLAFLGGPADVGIILALALVLFGPKRMPEIGRQLAQALREVRKITDEVTGSLHSVHEEVESAYKPVLTPPHEYGNPYAGTSSPTAERAGARRTYDQDPEDLMAPVVPSARHEPAHGPATEPATLEVVHAETPAAASAAQVYAEPAAQVTDPKGH